MRLLALFLTIMMLLPPVQAFADNPVQPTHELSWTEKVTHLKQIIVQKVEDSWTVVKSWWGTKPAQTARIPASSGKTEGGSNNSVHPPEASQIPPVVTAPESSVAGKGVVPTGGSKIQIDTSEGAIMPEDELPKLAMNQKEVESEESSRQMEADQLAAQRKASVPLIPTPLLQSYNEVAKKREQLPEVQKTAVQAAAPKLESAKSSINAKSGYHVQKEGREAQPGLKRDKAGVAKFDVTLPQKNPKAKGKNAVVMVHVKKLPRLDVGEEPQLSADALKVEPITIAQLQLTAVKQLQSPAVIDPKSTQMQTQKVVGPTAVAVSQARKLRETEALQNKILTATRISNMGAKPKAVSEVSVKPVKPLSENQLRMLSALMLLQKGDQCHIAIGLLYRLVDDPSLRREAQFYLSGCTAKLGLATEHFELVKQLLASEDPEFTTKVIEEIPVQWKYDQEVGIGQALLKLKNRNLVSAKARAKVDYLIAKAAIRDGQYQTALNYSQNVPAGFEKYPEAQYIFATSQYALGQASKAIATQEKLLNELEQSKKSPELTVMLRLNLGRIAFQDKQFEKAKEYFVQIDKNHPLWIDGLTQEGWAQIQAGDYSGAIGNMYSVHSPFFKDVYVPETYVIRTIGYLNICQYGDAYKSLTMLEQQYRPWLQSVEAYTAQKKDGEAYYATIRQYLKSNSNADVDGLPHQVIREIARQKDFLNHQVAINEHEDELGRFMQIENAIIKDKADVVNLLTRGRTHLVELREKIRVAKKANKLALYNQLVAEYRVQEGWIDFYRLKLSVHLDSRKAFTEMRARSEKTVMTVKNQLRREAENLLGRHLAHLRDELKQILDNNELLRYEVFSGSGENIRFQVAGGAVGRVPASVKPTSKQLHWEFDGEYWADEIGHYRSSLENNCPEAKGKEPAKLAGGGQ